MDVTNFYTVSTLEGPKDSTVNAPAGKKSGLPGLDFLDFILASLTQTSEQKTAQDQPLSSDNPVLDPNIDAADILAVNDDVREELKSWLFGDGSKLAQTLALNQKALDAALTPATNGVITSANVEAGSPQILQSLMIDTDGKAALEKLQAILAKIEKLQGGKDGGLALTNLTPDQLTELKAKIDALLNEDVSAALTEEEKRKALDGIYLGLIKLVEPQQQSQAALETAAKSGDINGQVNKMIRDEKPGAREDWIQQGLDEDTDNSQFSSLLKDFSGKKELNLTAAVKTPGVKPDLSVLQGWPFNIQGSIFAPMLPSQVPYDEFAAQSPALTVTGLGTLTNLVTQAHAASAPHPAMQVVAATISKAAANGETKAITLQLDPPELGRVEVRMSFGKDKTVKAVLLAEKPETLTMLQRDSHSLERALLDSGIQADGSSLSFELAHEGYQFNQQGQGGSDNYASRDAGPEEIIESTMTWRVDPETGHMRYDILV